MSDASIDCPLCFCPFPAAQIARHAANCNGVAPGGTDGGGGDCGEDSVAAAVAPTTALPMNHTNDAPAMPAKFPATEVPGAGMAQCPVCQREFPNTAIANHASTCGDGSGGGGGGDDSISGAFRFSSGDTTASGQCHGRCGRSGNVKYGGYCLTCLNRRGGTASLRPRTVQRQPLAGRNVDVCLGDITLESCEAIVNPANSKLDHASGVAGAIDRAAGPEFQEDCDALIASLPNNRLPTGHAAITRAGGSLQSRYVIHAVGPIWKGGDKGEPAALASCVRMSLALAHEKRLLSISLPAISSGIFGYPKERCARDMIDTVFHFLNDHPDTSLRTIRLTNVDDATVAIFKEALGSEPRPTCSVVRWAFGAEDKKQVLRVMHGSPYQTHRCSTAAIQKTSEEAVLAAPPPVAVVDFCNLGWELITPYIDDDDLRGRLQQQLRTVVSAEGLTSADCAADPVRAFAVRDTSVSDVRVAVAACASNKFDEASFRRLVTSAQAAIFIAAHTGTPVVAVPLLAANTLAFTNTQSARAVIEAARCVLEKRAELGHPALEIHLCEGIDSAFFVDALRAMFVAKKNTEEQGSGSSEDPGASVLAQLVEPAPLCFSAGVGSTTAPSGPTAGAAVDATTPAPEPPANETPKERRARLRAEAEAKLAMRLASENP